MAHQECLRSLGIIDPELQQHFDANPPEKVSFDDLSEFKRLVDDRNASRVSQLGPAPSHIKQTEVFYTAYGGRELRAMLYQPLSVRDENAKGPLIIMFHGGGFCLGLPEAEEQTCRNLVSAFGAVCLAPSYGLSPDHRFPTAVRDGWLAVKWAVAMAPEWGADLSAGFIVGGTSAGAQISTVMVHMARDEKLEPAITGHYLAGPALTPSHLIPEKYNEYNVSWEQNKAAPVLPREAVDMFLRAYQPDDSDGVSWAILNHPRGHGCVPPMFLQACGMDPLRDEGLIYEMMLRQEGVETKSEVYAGQPHGFWGWFPDLEKSKRFRKEQVEGMGWLLGKKPDMNAVILGGAGTST